MRFLSLRWKFGGILVFSNLFLGLVIIFIIRDTVTGTLEREVIERGRTIAQEIARYSAELILEEDLVGLREVITSSLSFESVGYILIQNAAQEVLVDTYNGNVPPELLARDLEQEINSQEAQLIKLTDTGSECYDIVVPVEEGSLGFIRIGMIRDYIMSKVQETNNYILLGIIIITLFGILIVYFLANRIVVPILSLARRANEISRGDLEESIKIKTNDEINYVAEAIERLRESLKIALSRLDKSKTIGM
jgi:HAMP domain-containing protein